MEFIVESSIYHKNLGIVLAKGKLFGKLEKGMKFVGDMHPNDVFILEKIPIVKFSEKTNAIVIGLKCSDFYKAENSLKGEILRPIQIKH